MAVIALVLTALGLGIFSLLLLGLTAQNSEEFGRFYSVILIVDVIGAAVLLGLIIGNLVRLLRDYRRRVPGARLKARMVFAFVGLAIAPVALVYLFAVQFLNTGIDTWFDVRVEDDGHQC